MKKTTFAFILFMLVLLAPYLYALQEWTSFRLDGEVAGKVFLNSAVQALASALFTLMLALPGALGLFWLRSRAPAAIVAAFEFAVLLPSLLPSLFVVVSFLNVIPFFPFGLSGVILLHGFSEVGLGAIVLHRILNQELSPYMDSAELMGSSKRFFLRAAAPLVTPAITQIFFILFLFFLSSLSIPVILAGGSYATIESAIYQGIVGLHDWNQSLNLFLLQAVCIALGFTVLGRFRSHMSDGNTLGSTPFLAWPAGLAILAFPVAVIVFSLVIKIPVGLIALSEQTEVLHGWQRYLTGSLLVGFLAGGGSFVGLSALCYFYQVANLRKYFALIMTPSLVILAFAFFLLPGEASGGTYLKIAAALTIGFLPALMRFGFLQKVDSLSDQVEAAELLGASMGKIFWRGLWPQALPQISLLSGLGAVWAMGDFAVSKIIAGRDMTLAMWVQSLVDQYRWDIALVLSWSILLASFIVFGFFWSLSYVSYKKLSENL